MSLDKFKSIALSSAPLMKRSKKIYNSSVAKYRCGKPAKG
jgi:hypothetical protein